MRGRPLVLTLALALVIASAAARGGDAREKELVDCINPMIGASTDRRYGEGKTFPGAATPFGLVQLSPDTITGGDNGPGYSWHHKTIEGFSFTHMSGIGWYGDLGNFQVMPVVSGASGPIETDRNRWKSEYSHDEETAVAGYYAVMLRRYGVLAEMTAAARAGVLRFTFPESKTSRIAIDLGRRVGQNGRWLGHGRQSVRVVGDHTIEGSIYCPSKDGGWGHGRGRVSYTVHFHARFSRPIADFGVWDRDKVTPGAREYEGQNAGFYVEFPTRKGENVLLKSGISFVSVEGARANLEHDIPGWDFEEARGRARALWAKAIDGVRIEGGTGAQREAFATALYHTMIDPRSASDADGRYIGADNEKHKVDDFTYRTIFSGWDVFRSQFPLQTIINPEVVNDEVNSLMQMAELSGRGYLPRWEILNAYSGCMVGDPAISVFADAYLKGIRRYDVEKAYAMCRQTSLGPKTNRNGWKDYNELGFVPGSVSCTLENAYFDYCVARFAQALGKEADAELFYKRAMNYRRIYDPGVGNMHARNRDGSWTGWRGNTGRGQGCVESNPYQQGWFVPHDVNGLVNLMNGGAPGGDHFLPYLTELFEKTPTSFRWNSYYNHANEPVHHVVYMFVHAGAPWLTQKWARIVMENAYGTGVKGLCGNEDVGQMSAWYVLSAMGFHPVAPGDNAYIIGSPLFDKITVRLDPKYYKGGSFTIVARNNSKENVYVRSASLNGRALERAWITHEEIASGGTLQFVMGPEPNTAWGSSPEHAPPSMGPLFKCTALEVDTLAADTPAAGKGARGGCVARATLEGLGGLLPGTFPVAVHLGEARLASGDVTLAPGERKTVGIPFSIEGRTEGEHTVSVLGCEATVRWVDTTPPSVVAVRAERKRIVVTFSEPVDPREAARPGRYSTRDGRSPDRVELSESGETATLVFGDPLPSGPDALTVRGVRDRSAARNRLEEAAHAFRVLDVAVTLERTEGAWGTLAMGGPSREDYADRSARNGAVVSYVPGFARPRANGGAVGTTLPRLNDGRAASSADDTPNCSWLDYAPEARVLVDLARLARVERVNVYSWHRSDRAPQRFVLYGSAEAKPPDAKAPVRVASGRPEPDARGAKELDDAWVRLGEVDTRKLGEGGKHASSISLGEQRLRHLLLVLLAPNAGAQGTFLTEIDVFARK